MAMILTVDEIHLGQSEETLLGREGWTLIRASSDGTKTYGSSTSLATVSKGSVIEATGQVLRLGNRVLLATENLVGNDRCLVHQALAAEFPSTELACLTPMPNRLDFPELQLHVFLDGDQIALLSLRHER